MDQTETFFEAVERGDLDTVRAMVAAAPTLVHARDATGATALHHAAFHGHRGVAELLHAATIAVVGEVPVERLRHAVPAFPTRSEVWLNFVEAAGL